MGRRVNVYLDDKENGGRKLVEVDLLEDRGSTILVKLPDGNTITRKKVRDLPPESGKKHEALQ